VARTITHSQLYPCFAIHPFAPTLQVTCKPQHAKRHNVHASDNNEATWLHSKTGLVSIPTRIMTHIQWKAGDVTVQRCRIVSILSVIQILCFACAFHSWLLSDGTRLTRMGAGEGNFVVTPLPWASRAAPGSLTRRRDHGCIMSLCNWHIVHLSPHPVLALGCLKNGGWPCISLAKSHGHYTHSLDYYSCNACEDPG
jgi:hypothetical protein